MFAGFIWRASIHEGAHVVALVALGAGDAIKNASADLDAYAKETNDDGTTDPHGRVNFKGLQLGDRAMMTVLVAGTIAERLSLGSAAESPGDYRKARVLAAIALRDPDACAFARGASEFVAAVRERRVERGPAIDDEIGAAEARAEAILVNHWDAVEAVASALFDRAPESLDGAELRRIAQSFNVATEAA